MTPLFDIKKNRWWAIPPAVMFIWHALYISIHQSPQFLLFVCYPANLLLISGILFRYPLFIGIGFGWTLVGLPLWLYSASLTGEFEMSCVFFHVAGVLVGLLSVRYYLFPRYTWLIAVVFAFCMQMLARFFTSEEYNINAAFRIYDGWEIIFSNYQTYMVTMTIFFSVYFWLFTSVNNRLFVSKKQI